MFKEIPPVWRTQTLIQLVASQARYYKLQTGLDKKKKKKRQILIFLGHIYKNKQALFLN